MAEPRLHPLDTGAARSPPTYPSLGTSVSFHSSIKSKENLAVPSDQNQQGPSAGNTTTANQLRNRLDSKPLTSSAPTNSGIAAGTGTSLPQCSNATTAGMLSNLSTDTPPPRTLTRRDTGPGGRLIVPENPDQPVKWTTTVSTFLKQLYSDYSPSLILENKGSIARDHLANERTYLAWLRSSLSLITVGVAVTQLFRLQSSAANGQPPSNELIKVSELGRPLGGSFVALGIMFLWIGTSRYFHNQSVLSYGQFPASRGSVIIATVTVMGVLLACFIIVILQGRSK
ncbi:hypothetical protein BGZ83_001607 [Gryganskiella cystojenkinii]|nr:hypothetical protein BGZ83_001607 [Gryganskiella cystojenkinii]